MKATIERAVLLKSLGHVQSVVERRNTIPILSNVLIEADASGQLKLMATDLDLQVVETIAAKVETAGTTTVSAHTLFEIARKLPEGSGGQPRRRRGQDAGPGRALELQAADAAARRFPGDRRGRPADQFRAAGRRADPDHRQDALRDLDRGNALLSQRHLPARRRRCVGSGAEGGGDRRPPPRALHGHASRWRVVDARRHRAAQMRHRNPQAARRGRGQCRNQPVGEQDPLPARQRDPDLEADRRHLPRLQPRHPDRERQAAQGRSEKPRIRASTASRRSPAKRPARSRSGSTRTASRCR